MKFSTDMKAFRAALAVAGKVIPAKSPWPIILNIKLVTNDNRVTMIGTDTDTTFEMDVQAEVMTEGAVAFSYATLTTFCAAAKATSLSVEVEKGSATLRAGKSRIVLSAVDVTDFPNYQPATGETVAVDRDTFCQAIKFCAAAASDEEARYYLNGPYIQERDGSVHVWGTDGHALHHAHLPGMTGIGGGGTLPMAATQIILGIAEKAETVHAMVCEHGWHVMAGPVRAWGKVIEGSFPDAMRVKDGFVGWQEFVVAGLDEITSAITVATCGTDTMANKARSLIIRADAGQPVIMRGAKGAAGIIHAGRAEMEASGKGHAAMCVSASLLSESVKAMAVKEFSLSYTDRDGTSAVLVTPAQKSAAIDMSALIMGIRATAEELADV
jgi:hypothetical protein